MQRRVKSHATQLFVRPLFKRLHKTDDKLLALTQNLRIPQLYKELHKKRKIGQENKRKHVIWGKHGKEEEMCLTLSLSIMNGSSQGTLQRPYFVNSHCFLTLLCHGFPATVFFETMSMTQSDPCTRRGVKHFEWRWVVTQNVCQPIFVLQKKMWVNPSKCWEVWNWMKRSDWSCLSELWIGRQIWPQPKFSFSMSFLCQKKLSVKASGATGPIIWMALSKCPIWEMLKSWIYMNSLVQMSNVGNVEKFKAGLIMSDFASWMIDNWGSYRQNTKHKMSIFIMTIDYVYVMNRSDRR